MTSPMSRSLGGGSYLRKCLVCGYPITAHSHALTAHEEECLNGKAKIMSGTITIPVGKVAVELLCAGDAIARMTANSKAWEPETRSIWHTLINEGEGVIDVGAYTGVYSIASAMLGARVLALEPHPVNYVRLRDNAAINSTRIRMLEAAASNHKGNRILYSKRNATEICDTASLDTQQAVAIRVSTVRLDDLMPEGRVCLIKIDTEYHECDVIRGAFDLLARDHPNVIAEILNPQERVRVSCLLAMIGYKWRCVLDGRNHLYIGGD